MAVHHTRDRRSVGDRCRRAGFFNNNHLRTMPNNPNDVHRAEASRDEAARRHLTVPTSARTPKDAKDDEGVRA